MHFCRSFVTGEANHCVHVNNKCPAKKIDWVALSFFPVIKRWFHAGDKSETFMPQKRVVLMMAQVDSRDNLLRDLKIITLPCTNILEIWKWVKRNTDGDNDDWNIKHRTVSSLPHQNKYSDWNKHTRLLKLKILKGNIHYQIQKAIVKGGLLLIEEFLQRHMNLSVNYSALPLQRSRNHEYKLFGQREIKSPITIHRLRKSRDSVRKFVVLYCLNLCCTIFSILTIRYVVLQILSYGSQSH